METEVVLIFEFVYKRFLCAHSNETSSGVLLHEMKFGIFL